MTNLFYGTILFLQKVEKMKQYLTFAILFELNKKEVVSAREIAEKFEISPRSVYRYLNELESAGIPTFTRPGKNGGIGIEKNFALESLLLTKNDKVCLRVALDSLPENQKEYLSQKLDL